MPQLPSPFDGLQKVKREPFAYHVEANLAETAISKMFNPQELCHLERIDYMRDGMTGIIVTKHSPYREILARKWLRIVEHGLFKKHVNYWEVIPAKCAPQSYFTSIKFGHIRSIIAFLMIAHMISALVLLCEIIHAATRKHRMRCMSRLSQSYGKLRGRCSR